MIAALEAAAEAYVEIRDERMALTEREVLAKLLVLREMHKAGKTVYKRGALEITVVPADESVKVRIKKPKDTEAAA